MNKIREFIENIKANLLTDEEISSFLLSLSKEEFYNMITLDTKATKESPEIAAILKEHQDIIAELLSDFSIEEKKRVIPKISKDFDYVRKMMFNTLTIPDLTELIKREPLKYLSDIISYIKNTPFSDEKDNLIAFILSTPNIYHNLNDSTITSLKYFIGDTKVILDSRHNIVQTTESDLKNESAGYIANLRSRNSQTLTQGILTKLSSKTLLWTLNEVNKGLQNIEEEPITIIEFINLLNIPYEKAILIVNSLSISEEEKHQIINSSFPDKKLTNKQLISDIAISIIKDTIIKISTNNQDDSINLLYQDILELPYIEDIFNYLHELNSSNNFSNMSKDSLLVLITQLISKESLTRHLSLNKIFLVEKEPPYSKRIEYNSESNTISLNINSFSTENTPLNFEDIISLIEETFYELRRAEITKMIRNDINIRSFYFTIDYLIRVYESKSTMTSQENQATYQDKVLDIDAELNSKISTSSFLGKKTFAGKYYWNMIEESIKSLAKLRKGPQNRGSKEDNKGSVKIVDYFFKVLKPYEIKSLKESSSVIDLITDDEGYRLDKESLLSRYNEFNLLLANSEDLPEDQLSQLKDILSFLEGYLKQEYPSINLSPELKKK